MKVECGSPRGEIVYWLVVSLFFLGFAGYFFYDHFWGYYNQNLANAATDAVLVQRPQVLAQLRGRRTPTDRDFRALKEARVASPQQLRDRLGEPLVTETTGAGDLAEHWPSVYGMITAISRNGRLDPNQMAWINWKHTADEIRDQFYWGLVPLGIAIVLPLRRLVSALLLRVKLDDSGLQYGRRTIAFAEMEALRDYNPKGWVDLYYRQAGQEQKLRLDNQKVARFDDIVAALCARKGFANPLQAPADAEAEA